MITYRSTRGLESGVTASRAVINGLAADGGLYVPEQIPALPADLKTLSGMTYQEIAAMVLSAFLSDYSEEEIRYCVSHAYDEKFDTKEIVPLVQKGDAWYLELFHGKTIAFKDMALSILPYLMTLAAKKNGYHEKIVILTATSGDTGKAAMAGFADVPGTEIIVFYPKEGVSPVQEQQMRTQTGKNTHVIAIRGNFDDAQTGVKRMFGDADLAKRLSGHGYRFSSANSINIGRLVPQIAYYVHAYAVLLRNGSIEEGERINVTVPTGNFGNILAAYYAKQMGLPIEKLICASNRNNVLTDFFSTGVYDRKRPFYVTSSPSMDILVSSNLERLLFSVSGENAQQTAELMKSLRETGSYTISDSMKHKLSDFYAGCAGEEEVQAEILRLYQEDRYVLDPHTAVASSVYGAYRKKTGDPRKTVIASTASPYKFARSVLHAVDAEQFDSLTDAEQFRALETVSGVKMPKAVDGLLDLPIRHDIVAEKEEMEAEVCRILNIL